MKLGGSFLFLCLLLFSGTHKGKVKAQRSKKKSGVKPPIKLGPGEVPIQEPRWQQVYDMKVTKYWKPVKSPNYPTFTGSQMQASWILEAPINWRVKVAFKDMSLAPRVGDSCRSVYVDLIDPKAGKSQGRSCSSEIPGDYVSMGSTMRLDLMSDKVAGKYRGFVAMAIITREVPGRRTSKTFPSRKTTAVLPSGKVNFNNFKSFQSKFKPPVPIIPKGVKFVYASDQELLEDTETDVIPTEKIDEDEWDDSPINQPDSSINQETGNKAAQKPAGPVPKGPVRYFAKIHPTKKAKSVDDVPNEDTTRETGDGSRDWLFYYGDSHQPKISDPIPIIRPDDDDKSWKFTTLHLVIISSAVVLSILIISVVFIIKRSCLDPVKHSKSVPQKIYESGNKSIELPRIDSDLKYKFECDSMVQYQNRPSNSEPVEHQVPFYGATPVHPMWNDFKRSASRNSLYHRPLPPPPDPSPPVDPPIRSIDVDEDYCSGDEDMVTMKHEYSCWELEKKKPKPITFEE